MPPRYTIRQVVGTYRRKAFGTRNEDGSPRRPAYPAAAIVAFYATLELAEEQPVRGHFESERLLAVLLEGPGGAGRAYARQVGFLVRCGDLVREEAGGLYVEGWQELQEGDVGIHDRVARFRRRKKAEQLTVGLTVPVTPKRTRAVTPPVTPSETPDETEEPRAKATRRGLLGVGEGYEERTSALTPDSQEPPVRAPEAPAETWFDGSGAAGYPDNEATTTEARR